MFRNVEKLDFMNQDEILKELRTIITNYVEDESLLEGLSNETDLIQDLQINSIHLVDIILDVEEAFDIEIDDDEAEKMMTVGASLSIISSKTEKS